jgi:hypothetical protein
MRYTAIVKTPNQFLGGCGRNLGSRNKTAVENKKDAKTAPVEAAITK